MTASLFYRVASVLLVLFAAGHTLGFRNTKGIEGADRVVELMQAGHLTVQGSPRTYWDFFVGFGLQMTAFLLFSAVLAWRLGGLSPATLSELSLITWGLALCFLAVAVLSWTNFFVVPGAFSSAIAACLFLAAWLAGRPT